MAAAVNWLVYVILAKATIDLGVAVTYAVQHRFALAAMFAGICIADAGSAFV